MARTNLHELASRLLASLDASAVDSRFVGKLRTAAAEAGLNSVRSADAVKVLEQLGRIDIEQRGRRGRDTIVRILSTEPVTLAEAESMLPSRTTPKRPPRLEYDDIGKRVVDRLLELGRDDALRTAQVEAFANEAAQARRRTAELEDELQNAASRESELRIRLRAAEESLQRAEENLRRAFGGSSSTARGPREGHPVQDEDARAVLDILRSSGP